MKRILVSLIITTAAVLAAGIAWAAWSAHSAPGTAASAKAPTMPAGPMPTVNVSGANVAVSFSQTSLGSSQVGSLSGGGYLVKRYTSGGTAQTGGTVVATPTATLDTVAHTWSTAALASALSPDGSYTVAARQTDTAGNTGAATSTFLLDTAPPTVAVSTTTNPVNSTNRTATSA